MRRPGHVRDYSAAGLGEFPAVNSSPGPLMPHPSGIWPKPTFACFVPRSAALALRLAWLAPHSDVLVPRLAGFDPEPIGDWKPLPAPVAPALKDAQSSRQPERE